MKRSIDSVGGVTAPPSALKRQNSAGEENEEDETISAAQFLLQNQNRGLSLELLSNKRSITEARKELELMRRKAREMETLVSLIQRAWSQLDIDASLILDSLGDSEVMIPDAGSTELLYRMLHISDKFTMLDPTSTDNIPKLETDQWSSTKDIEKAKATAEEQLSELPNISPEPSDISKPSQESANEDEMMEIGPEIEQHLAGHVQFTLSLLERVCNAINESGVFSSNQEILKSLAQTKESHAKIMFLNDSVAKLRSEIIQLESKLQLAENDKIKVEKKLDKALHSVKELEENGVKSVRKTTEVVVGEDGNSVVPTTEEDNENALESQIKELQLQIRLLEKQLVDSESAKAKVEMTLTERLSRPLPQIETQVADMRKAMEELRQQCKQRVNSMIIEHGAMHEREKDLTLALRQVEASVGEKIEEVVNLTKMKIQSINEEKLGLEAKLSTLKADFEIVDQLKAQLQEYQTLDESRNSKIKNLETQLKSNNDRMNTLEKHLKDSRKRELSLEQAIVSYEIPVPEHLRPKAAITEDGEISGGGSIDILTQQLIKQAHDRTAALEQELLEMKNSVNDLIMEIESVTTEESNARAQSERLLKQIQDCQSLQRAALEENLKLQNQLEELHKSTKEMEVKTEMIKKHMQEQESLFLLSRQENHKNSNEISSLNRLLKELQDAKQVEQQKAEEIQQKSTDIDRSVQAALKRNQELLERCNELSKQCERERKQRMEEVREVSKEKKVKKSSSSGGSSSGGAMNQDDADMLEMTLGMLRCSVCKDRFKSVTIKKCFHLFCKECIDENLRSRSRKCPACGEKFGQDDVANIYFTN